MNLSSPLRYPGGKAPMAGLLREIRRLNSLGGLAIAEPFAGGAGASLSLLFSESTHEIYINDADPAVHDFWWAVIHRSKEFVAMLRNRRVSMSEWRRQRDAYRRGDRASRTRRGFAMFYLNRCNRSGIVVNGGPIGGVQQLGEWKLGARFNKVELEKRCEKLAEYHGRIHVSGLDGLEFVGGRDASKTFFFMDPPYFVKGKTLYLSALSAEYHEELADRLREMKDDAWVLTYDDCRQVRKLYRSWATVRPFALRYVASERRSGHEVLIAPKWMRLPSWQTSAALTW